MHTPRTIAACASGSRQAEPGISLPLTARIAAPNELAPALASHRVARLAQYPERIVDRIGSFAVPSPHQRRSRQTDNEVLGRRARCELVVAAVHQPADAGGVERAIASGDVMRDQLAVGVGVVDEVPSLAVVTWVPAASADTTGHEAS